MIKPGSRVLVRAWGYSNEISEPRVISVGKPHPRGNINISFQSGGERVTSKGCGFLFHPHELEEFDELADW